MTGIGSDTVTDLVVTISAKGDSCGTLLVRCTLIVMACNTK